MGRKRPAHLLLGGSFQIQLLCPEDCISRIFGEASHVSSALGNVILIDKLELK